VFKFLKNDRLLTPEDLNERVEYLIDMFVLKQGITMWYSKEGQGKTWLSLAVAKRLLERPDVKRVIYMDMDNPRRNIAERNVERIFESHENFYFIHRSKIEVTPYELLVEIGREAYGDNYADVVFFFDATRDFVDGDMKNDTKVREMMDIVKNIREAGGTVILNQHTTKNGRGIDGSGEFTKSVDSLFRLTQIARTEREIHYELTVEKERSAIESQSFSVRPSDLRLGEIDPRIARMTPEDEAFVKSVKTELEKHADGENQSKLLTTLGYGKADKKARALLETFSGFFWQVRDGQNRQKIYHL